MRVWVRVRIKIWTNAKMSCHNLSLSPYLTPKKRTLKIISTSKSKVVLYIGENSRLSDVINFLPSSELYFSGGYGCRSKKRERIYGEFFYFICHKACFLYYWFRLPLIFFDFVCAHYCTLTCSLTCSLLSSHFPRCAFIPKWFRSFRVFFFHEWLFEVAFYCP